MTKKPAQEPKHLALYIALGTLLVIAIAGVVAVFVVPGDATSKTALAIAVVAAVIASAGYLTNLESEELAADVRRLREHADELFRRPLDCSRPTPNTQDRADWRWVVAVLVFVLWSCRLRRRSK